MPHILISFIFILNIAKLYMRRIAFIFNEVFGKRLKGFDPLYGLDDDTIRTGNSLYVCMRVYVCVCMYVCMSAYCTIMYAMKKV